MKKQEAIDILKLFNAYCNCDYEEGLDEERKDKKKRDLVHQIIELIPKAEIIKNKIKTDQMIEDLKKSWGTLLDRQLDDLSASIEWEAEKEGWYEELGKEVGWGKN